jgi:hypothetical protein
VGIDNHSLDDLPQCEQELVCRSFVQTLRWNNIDPTKGTISGRKPHGCVNYTNFHKPFGCNIQDTNTPICLFNGSQITSSFTSRKLLRRTRDVFGGKERFGFDPNDIGNHSIRSGAAMALFLMDHHPKKIMIPGRWKSEAFIDYIRPQVLEWTNLMSRDMVAFNSFTDLLEFGTIMGRGGRSKLDFLNTFCSLG